MEPQLFALFCEEFTKEMNRLRIEGRTEIEAAERDLAKINRELEKLLDLYLDDKMTKDDYVAKYDRLKQKQSERQTYLDASEAPPTLLHPNMALTYRNELDSLYEGLNSEDELVSPQTMDAIRSLIDKVVLIPQAFPEKVDTGLSSRNAPTKKEDKGFEIDLHGDLAGILRIASKCKKPRRNGACKTLDYSPNEVQFEMVAGAHVIITNVPNPRKPLDFKGFVRKVEQPDPVSVYSHYGRQWVSVHYTEEPSPIPGLIFYRLNNGINPLSNEPWGPRDKANEIYLRRDAEGAVDTYIECELAQSSSSPICDQRFYVKSIRTEVLIGYNRFYLPLWQKIESDLTRFMEGWVVPDDEIPPADPPVTRQPASGS